MEFVGIRLGKFRFSGPVSCLGGNSVVGEGKEGICAKKILGRFCRVGVVGVAQKSLGINGAIPGNV